MDNNAVPVAFDMLQEELERIIPDLNAQGKDLLDQKQYAQAHELINKAQSVVTFQGKVAALREEWVRMQVPPTKPPEPVLSPTPPKAKKFPGVLTLEDWKRVFAQKILTSICLFCEPWLIVAAVCNLPI